MNAFNYNLPYPNFNYLWLRHLRVERPSLLLVLSESVFDNTAMSRGQEGGGVEGGGGGGGSRSDAEQVGAIILCPWDTPDPQHR